MKKNFYSFIPYVVTFMFCGSTLFAQTDVTPAKFKFSAMSEASSTLFDEVVSGANPPANYAPVQNSTNGYVIVGGAPASYPAAGNSIKNNASVVFHPEMGHNVFMFKGKNSKETLGVAQPEAVGGFWSMNFYATKNVPAKTNVRMSVIMKCVAESEFGANDAIKLSVTSLANSVLNPDQEAIFLTDEGWWIYETDFMVPETTGCPPRFKFTIQDGKANNLSFYMTDIKLTANPVGTPIIDKYEPLSEDLADMNSTSIYASNGELRVSGHDNATIRIYSVSGTLIELIENTGDHFTKSLNKGFYIIQVGKKVSKIAI